MASGSVTLIATTRIRSPTPVPPNNATASTTTATARFPRMRLMGILTASRPARATATMMHAPSIPPHPRSSMGSTTTATRPSTKVSTPTVTASPTSTISVRTRRRAPGWGRTDVRCASSAPMATATASRTRLTAAHLRISQPWSSLTTVTAASPITCYPLAVRSWMRSPPAPPTPPTTGNSSAVSATSQIDSKAMGSSQDAKRGPSSRAFGNKGVEPVDE